MTLTNIKGNWKVIDVGQSQALPSAGCFEMECLLQPAFHFSESPTFIFFQFFLANNNNVPSNYTTQIGPGVYN
jgi:hypothetical protein